MLSRVNFLQIFTLPERTLYPLRDTIVAPNSYEQKSSPPPQ